MTNTNNARAYFLGLDLGQAADYSALAILERQGPPVEDSVYHCRHLQRWPLRTSYASIVVDTARVVRSAELQACMAAPVLAIDATGVGAPVVDLFKREFPHRDTGVHFHGDPLPPKQVVWVRPVQITGGSDVTYEGGFVRVPKRDLVSAAQVALQSERLKIAASLPEAATLTRELQNFQVKISLETAHDSYGAWREGAHDDLVLAVCLALWTASDAVRRAKIEQSYKEMPGTYGYIEYRW